MTHDESKLLLARCEQGDEHAAREIYDRYVARLIGLARSRLSRKVSRRVDPEDVVQSAFRSFFRKAEAGEFVLARTDDLWRLLAAITLHKTLKQVDRQFAQKRGLKNEESVGPEGSTLGIAPQRLAREPAPDEALMLLEELQLVMSNLLPLHREMLQLQLQGQSIEEISRSTERTEHQVRRVIKKVKEELEQRLAKL